MPSPLKSPVPTTVQLLGTLPIPAADVMVVPFRNHMAVLPLVSRHNRSALPLPSKSRCPTIDQIAGRLPRPPAEATPALFMSHMAMSPLMSRQAMSLTMLSLKSCVFVGWPRQYP